MAIYYVDGAVGSDLNTGTSPGAGNAFATIAKAELVVAAGDTVYIKASAVYDLTFSIVCTTYGFPSISWIGYQTTPGDNTGVRPEVTSSVAALDLVSCQTGGRVVDNIKFTHTGSPRGVGFNSIGGFSFFWVWTNCVFDGLFTSTTFNNSGGNSDAYSVMRYCDVINCTDVGVSVCGVDVYACRIANNAGHGVFITPTTLTLFQWVNRCVIYGNGGCGIATASNPSPFHLSENTIYGNTADGINIQDAGNTGVIDSNIIYGNGGYGIVTDVVQPSTFSRNNAFGGNTSGSRNVFPAGLDDVALSGNPFTNAGAGDFSLNATVGAGAACRAAGFPNVFPGGLTTGYPDIGAVQHQDSGGGGGGGGASYGRVIGG